MTDPGTELELADTSRQVRRAVAYWRLPARLAAAASSYIKNGQADLEAMIFAAERLEMLAVDPLPNLPDTFVVRDDNKGTFTFGMFAALQRALLPRAGYRIDFKEADDSHVTACMVFPDGRESTPLTIHGELTDIKAYAKRNAKNYEAKPRRMYEARVSTELISMYAADAIRAIATDAGVGPIALEPTEEVTPGPEYRADGSTLPAHLRQPQCPDDLRDALLERLAVLEQRAPEKVRDLAARLAPAKIPNLRKGGPDFKMAHGMLLDLLFREIEADLPELTEEAVPAGVYDASPESRGLDPE